MRLSSPWTVQRRAGSIENGRCLHVHHSVNNISHICWSDIKLTTKFKLKFITDADTSGYIYVMDQTLPELNICCLQINKTKNPHSCSEIFCDELVSEHMGAFPGDNELMYETIAWKYKVLSNISAPYRISNKIVDHSDLVGASPVSTALTTSSFST